eukprot:jgi/Chlat1/842/Chrsp104S01184
MLASQINTSAAPVATPIADKHTVADKEYSKCLNWGNAKRGKNWDVASASSHLHAQTPSSPSSSFTSTSSSSTRPELWLYSTFSRSKEQFVVDTSGKVAMYACGVTAYNYSHIGHARVYVAFDVLFRLLLHLDVVIRAHAENIFQDVCVRRSGYDVEYGRNVTNFDDKVIARARQLGEETLLCGATHTRKVETCTLTSGALRSTDSCRVEAGRLRRPQAIWEWRQMCANETQPMMQCGSVWPQLATPLEPSWDLPWVQEALGGPSNRQHEHPA